MKTPYARAALATALLLACPTFATASIPAPVPPQLPAAPDAPVAPTPSATPAPVKNPLVEWQNAPLWKAYMAVFSDLKPIFAQDGKIKNTLAQLDQFQFSADTRKQLFDLFGNDNPLHFKTSKPGKGSPTLSIVLDSLDYRDPKTGSKAHTAELSGKVTYNNLYTTARAVAALPLFTFEDGKTTQISATNFGFSSNQKLGPYDLWLGTALVRLGRLSINDASGAFHLNLDNFSFKSDVKQHGRQLDMGYDYLLKSIDWGKDSLGPVHMAVRMVNIDAKEFAAVAEKAKQLDKSTQTDAEKLAAATGLLKELGIAAIRHGGAIDIQDFSVQYHKLTARMNGRVSFENVQDSDFDSPRLLLDKINAKFNVRVPAALVDEVARVVARATLDAKSKKDGQPVTEAMVTQTGREFADKVMDKLLAEKLVRIEHRMVLSTLELKGGKLFVNGQLVNLLTAPAPVAPAPAAPPAPVVVPAPAPEGT